MKISGLKKENFNKVLEKTIEVIKNGGVVVCPTDTVYGLLADASNIKAIKKLFKIKKRPKIKAIPIFVGNIRETKKFAEISKEQENILKRHWPGKFTFILKRKKRLPGILFGDKKTIGLRVPRHKLVLDILKITGKPLTGTSANISGRPASGKFKDVFSQFEKEKNPPDLMIDGGNLPKSSASTIIDITGKKQKILRKP